MKGVSPPWEWIESRLCEDFHCLPSQLYREDPQTILRMASMRAYAQTKQELDHAKSEGDVKPSPLVDLVWEIQLEIIKDRKAKRESQSG